MIYAESKCRSRSVLRKHASSCGHGTLICFMHQRGPTLDPLFIYLSLYTSLYTSLSIPLYIHKGRRQVRQHGGSANMIMNANIILNPGPSLSIPLYIPLSKYLSIYLSIYKQAGNRYDSMGAAQQRMAQPPDRQHSAPQRTNCLSCKEPMVIVSLSFSLSLSLSLSLSVRVCIL